MSRLTNLEIKVQELESDLFLKEMRISELSNMLISLEIIVN